MKSIYAWILLVTLIVVEIAVASYVIGLPIRVSNISFDPRCNEHPNGVLSTNYRLMGVNNRTNLTMGDVQTFIEYQDRFNDLLAYFQEHEFGRTTQRTFKYVGDEHELIPISKVTIAKVIPPKFPGTKLPYLSWTMGDVLASIDVDGDDIPDPIVSSSDWRCAEDRYDVLIPSTSLRTAQGSVSAEVIGAQRLTSNRWTNKSTQPVSKYYRYKSATINGESVFIFDNRLVRTKQVGENLRPGNALDIDTVSVPIPEVSAHMIFINGQIVVVKDDALSFYKVSPDWKISRERDVSTVGFPFPIANVYPLPDVDGDKVDEIGIITRDRLIILLSGSSFDRRFDILFEEITSVETAWIGNMGDFDGDNRMDFWLSFPEAEDDDGHKVGRVLLLTNKSLSDHLARGSASLSQVTAVEVEGDARYEGVTTSGIGYDMADWAGDLNHDGAPDFVTVSHYSMRNAGMLYVLFHKDLFTKRRHRVSDPEIVRIVGTPLSYLGTGLDYSSDYTGDGYADILVGADVDHEAGFSAGALYLLSGSAIESIASTTGASH